MPSMGSRSTAAVAASSSASGCASATSGRNRTSTGKVRPETSMIGASSKWREKLPGSIVALVMMILRSGRRGMSCLR